MAIDTEEMIRAQPVDAVIAIGGCDKTVPAQLMGGISADKPFLPLITGPMMPGSVKGVRVGACTDCRSSWARYRAGELSIEDIVDVNEELAPTGGTCGVMGTASTMACLVAAMGLVELRAGATAAAVSSARLRVAEHTGAAAVKMLQLQDEGHRVRPQDLLSRDSFLNAITVLQAIGGSTNAIVHLLAIANRHPGVEPKITLKTIDEIGKKTPLLVDLKPSGEGYMTDFHSAGGMLALLHTLRPLLKLDARTYTGQTLGEMLDSKPFKVFPYSREVIRPMSEPLYKNSSLVVLYGNLAPRGAVMKASASHDKTLLRHRARAVVFEGTEDMSRRIDGEDLQVDEDSVLVLKGIGPVGNPGMPEAGLIPIPRKLGKKGIKDVLRVSDGRMSGTAAGSVVLHVSPEAADLEGAFGVIETGDWVSVDVGERKIEVEVTDEQLEERKKLRRQRVKQDGKASWVERDRKRGWRGLYERRVNQADEGADFDFLTARFEGYGIEGRD